MKYCDIEYINIFLHPQSKQNSFLPDSAVLCSHSDMWLYKSIKEKV